MCGLIGVVGTVAIESIERAVATLRHRGPDGSGLWRSAEGSVTLGHARLAVIDLTAAGHQPMVSHDGRMVLVLNGEIYNHQEIRCELDALRVGRAWRGHSDTETLLEAIGVWGVERALQRTVGMFAMALWDNEGRRLTIARDRMGEKPLYYWRDRERFCFGSELKALRMVTGVAHAIDRNGVADYLRLGYIPAPRSILEGVSKLLPGTTLTVAAEAPTGGTPRAFWSLRQAIISGAGSPFAGTASEAAAELDRLLVDSVRLQQVADVPVGVFLSGGVDSTAVAAATQAIRGAPIQSFTIGSTDPRFDESASAREIARALGTQHHELIASPENLMRFVATLPAVFDEPFADYSQLPTMLVSEWARAFVTVCLSGDGGDELFGGYNRHVWASRVSKIPRSLRLCGAQALGVLPPQQWDRAHASFAPYLPSRLRVRLVGDKAMKLRAALRTTDPSQTYRVLVAIGVDLHGSTLSAEATDQPHDHWADLPAYLDDAAKMMAVDALTYLPDDILCKVDRSAMAASLETRAPFLDHRIVEFAWRLPTHWKVYRGQSKWILKQALARRLPRKLWERPKAGFGIPLDAWLRGPLREWADSLLSDVQLRNQDLLDAPTVTRIWAEHLSMQADWTRELWVVLMLQQWRARWEATPELVA